MIKIDHSYDSHVHFFGVGLPSVDWITKDLNSPPKDLLKNKSLIRGFGLSPKITEVQIEKLLEEHPDHFFCLSFDDGHSSLVSKNLTHKLDFEPKNHFKETKSSYTLFEQERDLFLKKLPKRTTQELKKMALHALKYFKANKISAVRNMTTTHDEWLALKEVYQEKKELNFKIETYFSEFMTQTYEQARSAFITARENRFSNLVRPQGLKIFIDGSIGQNTAAMSSNNENFYRLSDSQIKQRMCDAFIELKSDLAVHTIGDEALEKALMFFSELSNDHDIKNTLHLEHASIFTQKSLKLLKTKKLKCAFHFQPSHWIKDKIWYKKNHKDLTDHQIYPFNFLINCGYPFDFGSDAPIEESFKELTLKGISEIEKSRKT